MPEIDRVVQLWERYGAGYDSAFTAANHEVAQVALELAGLESGMSLLDIAAGSGALAIPAAQMGAQVLAIDLAPGMLELLRARAAREGIDGIETRVMDGTALDVEDGSFDLVCSQYGVMFFPDEGLPEMRRVLVPGGAAAAITWGDENVSLHVYRAAIALAVPELELAPEAPLIEDPQRLAPMMTAAGFEQVKLHTFVHGYPASSPEDMWRWMEQASPGYAALVAGLAEEQRAAVHDAVLTETERRYGSSFESLPMGSVIGIGRRPR